MSRDWESVFETWSQGPSATEQQKADNAEKQIRQAVASSEKLRNRDIRIFTQGSYRNRVNVRQDSDVDIGVVCFDTFFPDYTDDNVKSVLQKSLADSTYAYATFKNEIEEALVNRFGRTAVTRGNKSFDIKENTYRVEADVAAFFEHRRYISTTHYLSGVEMIPDNHKPLTVRNWPEQHYENGVRKNTNTNRRYKRLIRILKNLSNEMSLDGIVSAKNTPSFLVECLVWNAPNDCFVFDSHKSRVRNVLAYLFNNTIKENDCSEWGEVSELKYLFKGLQQWTWQSAHKFISDAWDYMGLE